MAGPRHAWDAEAAGARVSTAKLLAALAHLPGDAHVTITVQVADLRTALEARAGGPATLTTRQAATILGYSSKQWARWCVAGVIGGAWQDTDGGSWRMPRTACEARIEEQRRRGRRPGASAESRRHLPRGPRRRRWPPEQAPEQRGRG